MAKKKAVARKKEHRVIRYLREVRAEIRKVIWPSRQSTINLTSIVLGVTVAMSVAMGLLDWLFARLFALIIG